MRGERQRDDAVARAEKLEARVCELEGALRRADDERQRSEAQVRELEAELLLPAELLHFLRQFPLGSRELELLDRNTKNSLQSLYLQMASKRLFVSPAGAPMTADFWASTHEAHQSKVLVLNNAI